jgi:hypothetical protein
MSPERDPRTDAKYTDVSRERAFLAASALLFIASAVAAVYWCRPMFLNGVKAQIGFKLPLFQVRWKAKNLPEPPKISKES